MPIVRIEMWSGRTAVQKKELTRVITDAVVNIAHTTPEATIVIFQDIAKDDWAQGGKLASEPEVDDSLASGADDLRPVYLQTAHQSAGATVMRLSNPPGHGPSPHIHTKMEESFYVLEGQYSFSLGDTDIGGGPGTFVFVTPGTLHSFKNVGDTVGRLLCICTPPGIEKYFQELEAYGWPPISAPPEELGRLRAKYDTTEP
jgi:4-oxalocrotonate tautomerase family enzyme